MHLHDDSRPLRRHLRRLGPAPGGSPRPRPPPPGLLAPCLAVLAAPAFSGALDRTGQPIDPLFEPGGYVELSFGRGYPDVSGRQVADIPTIRGVVPAGSESGDIAESFWTVGFAIKRDFTDSLSGAVIYDQPFGADVDYPTGQYFLSGANATVDSEAVTALLRYRLDNGLSVHGGLRFQRVEGSVTIPFVTALAGPTAGLPYTNSSDADEGVGYVAGVAYERPEIALRVALTYSSEVAHELPTTEGGPIPAESTTEIELPQSVRLDFQTGIAPGTLVFGSIRWADWSDFEIRPQSYSNPLVTGAPLLFYPNDITTYTLGLGRQFTERFSGGVSVSYEDQSDDFVTNLGPTSGIAAIGLAGTYAFERVEVTGAVRYGFIGDARTALGGAQVTEFEDNDVLGLGLQIAYRF